MDGGQAGLVVDGAEGFDEPTDPGNHGVAFGVQVQHVVDQGFLDEGHIASDDEVDIPSRMHQPGGNAAEGTGSAYLVGNGADVVSRVSGGMIGYDYDLPADTASKFDHVLDQRSTGQVDEGLIDSTEAKSKAAG